MHLITTVEMDMFKREDILKWLQDEDWEERVTESIFHGIWLCCWWYFSVIKSFFPAVFRRQLCMLTSIMDTEGYMLYSMS